MINSFKLFSLPNYSVDRIIRLTNYSVDRIIRFSTEYRIMIFGYEPNINYLPNIIWLNRISTIRLQPWCIYMCIYMSVCSELIEETGRPPELIFGM